MLRFLRRGPPPPGRFERRRSAAPAAALLLPLMLTALMSGNASAQHVSELTVRDKTELFIQHMVKFMRVEPENYRAMVLEYEIAVALSEIAQVPEDSFSGNFIVDALAELVPDFAAAKAKVDAGAPDARDALRGLSRHLDPYVAGNALLLAAELDFQAGRIDEAVDICETIALQYRKHVIDAYRGCELIAEAFAKGEKDLLEFAQLYILLVDYDVDLPPAVQRRAQGRLNALQQKIGKPLHTIAGWMNQVEHALDAERTGERTQEQENEILASLNKLIELQEAIERKP